MSCVLFRINDNYYIFNSHPFYSHDEAPLQLSLDSTHILKFVNFDDAVKFIFGEVMPGIGNFKDSVFRIDDLSGTDQNKFQNDSKFFQ